MSLDAKNVLKRDYGIKLVETETALRPGRWENYGKRIINSFISNSPEMLVAQLRFEEEIHKLNPKGELVFDKDGAPLMVKRRRTINFYYGPASDAFYIRHETVKKKPFINNNGEEDYDRILTSDFYSRKSKNKNEKGEYIYARTGDVITKEEFEALDPVELPTLDTFARRYICEIFRWALSKTQYNPSADQITDVRPEEIEDKENGGMKPTGIVKYTPEQKDYICKQIRAFVRGDRNVEPEVSNTMPEESAPEQQEDAAEKV